MGMDEGSERGRGLERIVFFPLSLSCYVRYIICIWIWIRWTGRPWVCLKLKRCGCILHFAFAFAMVWFDLVWVGFALLYITVHIVPRIK